MQPEVFAGLSLMPDLHFTEATCDLFEEGIVDWVEWTIDMGWGKKGVPAWLDSLLNFYGNAHRLSGHGVQFSALSAQSLEEHEDWLARLEEEVASRNYVHLSEHFGYARAGTYSFTAPLPIPLCAQQVSIGNERLHKIADIVKCPVGLENLALAFSEKEVQQQGRFLEELLSPIDGFVVLDLHNIYCQSLNFGVPMIELIKTYPLDRVREIHISGGSFSQSKFAPKPIRRDTHDGPVPKDLFEILPAVLDLCRSTEVVILERINNTLSEKHDRETFSNEFRNLRKIISKFNKADRSKWPNWGFKNSATRGGDDRNVLFCLDQTGINSDISIEDLIALQATLLDLLEMDIDALEIKKRIMSMKELESLKEYLELLEPRMLDVGQELIRKWGRKRGEGKAMSAELAL